MGDCRVRMLAGSGPCNPLAGHIIRSYLGRLENKTERIHFERAKAANGKTGKPHIWAQMKKLSQIFFLAVLAACLHLTVNSAAISETDPFPTIVLPIYQGGYDIENSFNRMKGTKGLAYKVQTNYPAAEVLEFYDAVFNGKGWKPSFEICQRHWASLDDGSIKRKFQAKQLFTSWEHPPLRLQISLLLEYKPSSTNGRDEIIVQCRLQPQLDNSRHDKFIGRLKASGQYRAFTQKLNDYRKPDGEVDPALIGRDIRDNKADENLIEYKQILDEEKQAIDDIIHRANI